jgi:hypothetical protein
MLVLLWAELYAADDISVWRPSSPDFPPDFQTLAESLRVVIIPSDDGLGLAASQLHRGPGHRVKRSAHFTLPGLQAT